MENPDDIVGHKTFDTGERDENGLPIFRHEPLTRAEGDALWEAAEKAKKDREARMPDEMTAVRAFFDAWQRLKELGWREAIYCPKDGSSFQMIEPGSTGIHDGSYYGEWPNGSWQAHDEHDIYPSHPALFKLYPEDQAKYEAKMAEARERFRREITETDH